MMTVREIYNESYRLHREHSSLLWAQRQTARNTHQYIVIEDSIKANRFINKRLMGQTFGDTSLMNAYIAGARSREAKLLFDACAPLRTTRPIDHKINHRKPGDFAGRHARRKSPFGVAS